MTQTTVNARQRWSQDRPCPGCGGWDRMPRGQGKRCGGFMGTDGKYFHCSREEHAGALEQEAGGTYAHRLEGPCRCGATHRDAPPAERDTRPANGHRNGNGAHHGGNGRSAWREVGRWEYEGGLVVVRAEDEQGNKAYWQRHRTADGREEKGIGNAPRTLYRAAAVTSAPKEAFIWLVEGEKCADALIDCGFVSTTTPQGASSWSKTGDRAAELLRGRSVVIVPDNDEQGHRYAADARATLERVCASLRVLELPELGDGEDVYDWLKRGGDPEDLVKMAEAQPNIATPPPARIEWISTTGIFATLPPTRWLSSELGFCPGRPAMLAGYGYSGKTIIAQSVAVALAAGVDIWGHFPTRECIRVRHFDYEQGQHATRKRYQRLVAGMHLDPRDLGHRLELCVFPDVYLNSSDAVDVYAKETEGCGLVILDALRGATPGEDENDSATRICIDMLARVSEKNGTTFLILHHARKTKETDKGGDLRMILRGSSGIFDACGSVLVLGGDRDEPRLVQQVKAPAEAEGTAAEPFILRIEDVDLRGNPRAGVRIVWEEKAKPEPETDEAKDQPSKYDKIAKAALALVRSRPGEIKTRTALAMSFGIGGKQERLEVIRDLETEKKLAIAAGGYRVQS